MRWFFKAKKTAFSMTPKDYFKKRIAVSICLLSCLALSLTGCSSKQGVTLLDKAGHKKNAQIDETTKGSRDNTP